MKKRIENLIAEYDAKIKTTEERIEIAIMERNEFKSQGDKTMVQFCREDIKKLNGEANAFYQARADIESLLVAI